ncbi:MAG TPA: CocE/NonD family hydrolase [Candidatus Thermoplasmatota archaeon]|nr:CocE/NonD family hydrolase [Candidatus Thermoplasmatota archaeon]
MRSSVAALALAALFVVAATGFMTGAQRGGGQQTLLELDATSFDATVESFDGTPIELTVYRPAGASAQAPVPVVLHSHGWAGTRTTDGSGIVGRLWNAQFGVVSIDARGHGASGGFANVHHKDVEVRDLRVVLDWIHDNLDWVQREDTGIAKDIVAGGAGYSYAGGMQLMTASYDARLDAIAPEITWSDLPDALAPAGVPKSLWLDFLVGTAHASGTRVEPRILEWYEQALVENKLPPAALEHLEGSSPVLRTIRADVLLIQGVPDTLFPLNHALRTYEALDGWVDVRLFTHLTGHVAPYLQPFGTTPHRHGIFLDEGPCGKVSDTVVAWLDEKLRGGPASGIPKVSLAMEDRSCVRLDALPGGIALARHDLVPAPSAAGALLLPLAEGPLAIAGAPRLAASVDAASPGGTAFASLVVVGADGFTRVVNDQSMPLPLTPGATLDAELAAVATTLKEGDRLLLRLEGLNEWYPHNGARLPGGALLRNVVVTLPTVV